MFPSRQLNHSRGFGVARSTTALHWLLAALVASLISSRSVQAQPGSQIYMSVLYSFTNGTDGAYPNTGLTQGLDGNFYGTTLNTDNGQSTIFQVTPSGTLTTLHTLTGLDGLYAQGALCLGQNGIFYGVSHEGGTNGKGTIFQITTNGVFTTLYSFTNGTDGAYPAGGLIQDSNGLLDGEAGGGAGGYGLVFQITTNGKFTVLNSNSFTYSRYGAGAGPSGGLVQGSDSNLYGTTSGGSTNGQGAVFRMTTNGILTTLHSFAPFQDGVSPVGPLVQSSDGNFYGVNYEGVDGYPNVGGTIYRITPAGAFTILHVFTNGVDGKNPRGGLISGANGVLYGTTFYGGGTNNNSGTIFQITTNGVFMPLYYPRLFGVAYSYLEGMAPIGALTESTNGILYGTTFAGGIGNGTVYSLQPNGSPEIVIQPSSQIVQAGLNATYGVAVRGTLPVSYQWQFDGTNIAGATNASLTVTNGQPPIAGVYDVVVANPYGTIVSSNAISLPVSNSPPIITGQPQSIQVPIDDNITFSVSAIGVAPLSYQWQFNGTIITGATNAILALSNVQLPNGGNYSVVVSNAFGTNVSSAANLSFSQTSVVQWGEDGSYVPPGLTNVVGIAAGGSFSLALNADGSVVGWGPNIIADNIITGQTVPAGLTNIIAIAAGYSDGMALKADGTVAVWGDNTYGQTNLPAGLNNVVAISAGFRCCLALLTNGTVVAWGDNTYGQCNVPANVTNAVAIAGGDVNAFALLANQTVVAWGSSGLGDTIIPSGLTNAVTLGIGETGGNGIAIKADGTMAFWGFYGANGLPSNLTNLISASVDANFGMALNANHTIIIWGDGQFGDTNLPPGLTNVIAISAGSAFGMALDPAGGALYISVGFGGSGRQAYLNCQIGPPAALAAGATWRATGMTNWSSATKYTPTFSQGQTATVIFQSIPGWITPPSQNFVLTLGIVTVGYANYSPIPPVLSFAGSGLGITGTTGTTYRIEYRTNLVGGGWLPLQTNTIGATGATNLPSLSATNGPTRFYRAVWLP